MDQRGGHLWEVVPMLVSTVLLNSNFLNLQLKLQYNTKNSNFVNFIHVQYHILKQCLFRQQICAQHFVYLYVSHSSVLVVFRVRTKSWILEKVWKFANYFSRPGKSMEIKGKVLKNGMKSGRFSSRSSRCLKARWNLCNVADFTWINLAKRQNTL